jgi:hypothetical protein
VLVGGVLVGGVLVGGVLVGGVLGLLHCGGIGLWY